MNVYNQRNLLQLADHHGTYILGISLFSKIRLVVYYQCCVLIG